jgi:hypothetical protein
MKYDSKEAEDIFDEEMYALLNMLSDHYRDDDMVARLLSCALSYHLWSCQDFGIAEKVLNCLGASLDDLFGQLQVKEPTVASTSAAIH